MVKRLKAFAGMSRMKRLALVVLARTLTDNDVKRLRVREMHLGVWDRQYKGAWRLGKGQKKLGLLMVVTSISTVRRHGNAGVQPLARSG